MNDRGAMYRLKQVRVEREGRCVLDVDELVVAGGRSTVFWGPNGAGKSTLLRVLAFLLTPASGDVRFGDATVSYREADLTRLRRQVTYVAQSPFAFHRSVYANVAYGLQAHGLPVEEERVRVALEAVGLDGFAGRPAWKLSGGETQRLAIARSLAIDPPVYLFDEPTANIDRSSVAAIDALLVDLKRRGKTVILSTHDLDQARRLADEMVALDGGRIVAAPLLNVLAGTTTIIGGRHYFESGGLRVELPDASRPQAIALDADELIVSRSPIESSARNSFRGTITAVARDRRGIVLTIDCGPPLLARITPHSFDEMGLAVGVDVYVTFKSMVIRGLGQGF